MIKSFEMNQPQTYMGSSVYVGWMRTMFICGTFLLSFLTCIMMKMKTAQTNVSISIVILVIVLCNSTKSLKVQPICIYRTPISNLLIDVEL